MIMPRYRHHRPFADFLQHQCLVAEDSNRVKESLSTGFCFGLNVNGLCWKHSHALAAQDNERETGGASSNVPGLTLNTMIAARLADRFTDSVLLEVSASLSLSCLGIISDQPG